MVKATLRSAVLLGVVGVGMLATSMPSFAEVQNVRVSGDVTVRAFYRDNLDLHQENTSLDPSGVVAGAPLETDNFFMTTTGVNVGADLTENVSAYIRLVNERDWAIDGAGTGDIDVSQSYITLKELFYSPLTLRVGTQPIQWGRGLVLGSNLLPTVLGGIGAGDDRNAAITANEYTDFTAFDAVRATLDLGGFSGDTPLSADLVYIKLDENFTGISDDINVIGVNFSSQLSDASEVEAYYLNKRGKNTPGLGATLVVDKDSSVNTFGVRGSMGPSEASNVYGELAYQFGDIGIQYDASLPPQVGDNQSAWLINLGGDVTVGDEMPTTIGGEWVFTSGRDVDGAINGWDPIAPGYFPTLIRSFQTSSTGAGLNAPDQTFVPGSYTNQHELALYASLSPMEDLTVGQRVSWFIAPVGTLVRSNTPGTQGTQERNSHIGTEWDTRITYDYTDDVQFGLDYGIFWPGSVFRSTPSTAGPTGNVGGDDTAQQLVSTVSLKF